ncbi:MAG: rRNA maturation RNase YbeY [Lachnospiraceae bacterium]|nr:rRNA maturation RNase YbeY [Lachnospiraceae bacterium]
MTFYAENETSFEFDFDWEAVYQEVALAVLDSEGCPYETEVNLLLTDNEGIHEFNKETRNIDAPTDVLSYPNVEYDVPGNFDVAEEQEAGCFNPDSGELILGDIIISVDKVITQANEYGHSPKREFAFLVAHSMLHLSGYDHMTPEEEQEMIKKQELVLNTLGITRD